MISVKGASFGRFGGWRRRYPGGAECRSIFLTVARAMPNRLAASRWLRPSTWQASRTRRYRSTVYILPPSISKKIEGYRWQSFTPPAAGKSRRFRGLICHRRSQMCPVNGGEILYAAAACAGVRVPRSMSARRQGSEVDVRKGCDGLVCSAGAVRTLPRSTGRVFFLSRMPHQQYPHPAQSRPANSA